MRQSVYWLAKGEHQTLVDTALADLRRSVGEPSTQMTLNTFHFAGAHFRETGVPA